jgi:hypothetical protein
MIYKEILISMGQMFFKLKGSKIYVKDDRKCVKNLSL